MGQDEQSLWNGSDYLRAVLRAPVYEVAEHTPLEPMPAISARVGHPVLVKREDRQQVHSFKIRGAYARMRQLDAAARARGVVTASAGNHAQGVALSARTMGITASIVMPVITPVIKVNAVRALGGQVILHGRTFDDAAAHARHLAETEGLEYIAPFDDRWVIAGQGTIGLELIQQDAALTHVFVPVGGGGLAAGIAVVIKQLMPQVQVIAVEPEDSSCLGAAIKAGQPVTLERVSAYAEGVAVKRVGDETFRLCSRYLDDLVIVSSDEISAAVKDLFEDVRAVAEPAGAVALAGLKAYADSHELPEDARLACILSGANLNFHSLRYISERAELGERREALLGVTIPERQGEYLRFCKLIGDRAVTEFNYRVAGEKAHIFVGLALSGGDAERGQILKLLRGGGYEVVDLTEDEVAKQHVRYMVGGRPQRELRESVFAFEFPEAPGALRDFLVQLGTRWNITLFHYRSYGTDYGRVLVAFENVAGDELFAQHVQDLGYECHEVTDSPAYKHFLA